MSDPVKPIRDLLDTVNHLQWYTPEKLSQIQLRKFMDLVHYHKKHSPFFAERTKDIDLSPMGLLGRLPILKRADLQAAGNKFFATEVPKEHGNIGEVKSSGSTGEPVVIKATNVTATFFHAFNIQEMMMHNRDPRMKAASIKANITETKVYEKWGMPLDAFFGETGRSLAIKGSTDIVEQDRLLREFKPELLTVYPSNLSALLDIWEENPIDWKIQHIKSMGETLSDTIRQRVTKILGIKVEDTYSSQELGTIAIQCSTGLYHTMDQNLLVEVLDDNYKPVKQGEIGRVVVTDIHNYASPMIRYETGDYAVRGGRCKCGRGLQTLVEVRGRERNLILRADGTRYWPLVGMYQFDDLDFKIRRYQVIQLDRKIIEYKIVTDAPLSAEQEEALLAVAQSALGAEFTIKINRIDAFPYAKNGKFEEFICLAQ